MEYRKLANSELNVSVLSLGTMTFGQQNTEAEAHTQLSTARDHGINLIDTAEMYPIPPRAETQGLTESYIGSWLKNQPRDQIILASKIIGPARGYDWIRDDPRVNPAQIEIALNNSLKRLKTDYIDLYQIHWPDRYVPMFGASSFDPKNERDTTPINEQLEALSKWVKAGKIRYIGLSNETPWGAAEFCRYSKELGLEPIISIQNAYNLINRTFEDGLSEVCHHHDIGLLCYSPLASGWLTGKYHQSSAPENARLTLFPQFGQRYRKPNVIAAAQAYIDLAQKNGLTPTTLALAFARQRWFTSSVIIGATQTEQLLENIASAQTILSDEILAEIDQIHLRYPNPAP